MTPALETQKAAAPARTTAQNSKREQVNTTPRTQKQGGTTLGFSLFYEPLAGQASLADIRQRLELKAAACAALGKFAGYPVDVRRIRNSRLRALVAAGMVFQDWSVRDLVECSGVLEGPATSALIATLERPRWSEEDFRLLGLVEKLEAMQSRALGGGATL